MPVDIDEHADRLQSDGQTHGQAKGCTHRETGRQTDK